MGAPASQRRLRLVRPDEPQAEKRAANDVQSARIATPLPSRRSPLPAPATLDELVDRLEDIEVPAAVVCARCGLSDCGGCDASLTRSGVIALIAWERPGPVWQRLWLTARATTRDPEGFFEALPDGPLAPALRFAFASELIASFAMVVALSPLLAAVAPSWVHDVLHGGASLAFAARAVLVGVPMLAILLVTAHAAHGLSIDLGARRAGSASAASRALRFGLYATGWDLVLGPLGAVVVAAKEGIGASLALGRLAVGLPGRSARAFVRGAYFLSGDAAESTLRVSYVAAIVASLVASLLILAAIAALMML